MRRQALSSLNTAMRRTKPLFEFVVVFKGTDSPNRWMPFRLKQTILTSLPSFLFFSCPLAFATASCFSSHHRSAGERFFPMQKSYQPMEKARTYPHRMQQPHGLPFLEGSNRLLPQGAGSPAPVLTASQHDASRSCRAQHRRLLHHRE